MKLGRHNCLKAVNGYANIRVTSHNDQGFEHTGLVLLQLIPQDYEHSQESATRITV